jgi:hypothetical protein
VDLPLAQTKPLSSDGKPFTVSMRRWPVDPKPIVLRRKDGQVLHGDLGAGAVGGNRLVTCRRNGERSAVDAGR